VVIAAIREDGGNINFEIYPRAINMYIFVAFFRQLSLKLSGDDFTLSLDNLSVHKTRDAKLLFEELKITEIFKLPICSQFNGIESYFSQIKATYKKMFLESVIRRYLTIQ
jgi:transcription elongation factor GreA-like protein